MLFIITWPVPRSSFVYDTHPRVNMVRVGWLGRSLCGVNSHKTPISYFFSPAGGRAAHSLANCGVCSSITVDYRRARGW